MINAPRQWIEGSTGLSPVLLEVILRLACRSCIIALASEALIPVFGVFRVFFLALILSGCGVDRGASFSWLASRSGGCR